VGFAFDLEEFPMFSHLRALVLGACCLAASGQLRAGEDKLVAKTDPIFPTLDAFRASLANDYEKGKQIRAIFSAWRHVDSTAAAKLFPNLQFASLSWSMERHPEAKESVALAAGLEVTLAIDRTTKRQAAVLYCWGNHDEYGKLLIDHKIPLRDEKEAHLVWDAFCELHHHGSKTAPLKKVSPTEWHLGISSYDQTIRHPSREGVTRANCSAHGN
jgi:hypothetical protein